MNFPLEDGQLRSILHDAKQGKRIACFEGMCTGTIDADGNCKICGMNIVNFNEIAKMKVFLNLAEERGQDIDELLESLKLDPKVIDTLKDLAQDLRLIKFSEDIYKNHKFVKLKDHLGFKRLSVIITILIHIIFLLISLNEFSYISNATHLDFIIALFLPIVPGSVTYLMIRIIFWIIDGFRKERRS
jgi:hypothetical protein